MKKCKHCGGNYKLSTQEHILETRHMKRPKMVIENLPVLQCTICGKTVMTEHSVIMIKTLKDKMRQEMEQMAADASKENDAIHLIRKAIRKITG